MVNALNQGHVAKKSIKLRKGPSEGLFYFSNKHDPRGSTNSSCC